MRLSGAAAALTCVSLVAALTARQEPTRPALDPGSRVLLDAHNAYPENGRWIDRLDRALSTGMPVAIEQDLVWWRDPSTGIGRSIVSHGAPFTGDEPSLEAYFLRRIAPLVAHAHRENRVETWPLITLNLDFKTNEPEHHRAVWELLGRYESWLVTAERLSAPSDVAPLRAAPVMVLTGSHEAQQHAFHDAVPVGQRLRLFGAVDTTGGARGVRTNYRRWVNYPWSAVEREGQPAAGAWTADDADRLHRLVDRAHSGGLWIRFYTLNGHDEPDSGGGWTATYNFGSLSAVRERWSAAVNAGVDFIATDQYEELSRHLATRVIRGRLTRDDYERLLEHEFDVPRGAARVDVELSYRNDEGTVIDLGIRDADGIRGWSGGGPQQVFIASHSASFGYTPGRLNPGRWAVVLGVPNIRPGVTTPYELRVRFNEGASAWPTLRGGRRWYVGDLHSHSGHSDGRVQSATGVRQRASAHDVFDAARRHGLEFLALTDHNTASHWADVDRSQSSYPDMLLLHGREVTTYRGHLNTLGETHFRDFRLGPAASMPVLLDTLRSSGTFVSINHPTLPDDERCMGCGWNDTDGDTMSRVDGIEILNADGAGDLLAGWRFWAAMLNRGYRVVAVGGSDEHTPAEHQDRQLGTPATVVCADAWSETAIVAALRHGRAYVRVRGVDGPALEFHGRPIRSDRVELFVNTTGARGQRVEWIRRGEVIGSDLLDASGAAMLRTSSGPGDWFAVRLFDSLGPTAFSNAFFHGDAGGRCAP